MGSVAQGIRRFILVQASDTPWLVVSGTLGFVTEGAATALGIHHFSPGWLFWLKTIGFYGYLLGYASFRFNRSGRGFVAGLLAGLAYVLANRYLYVFEAGDGGAKAWLTVAWLAWVAVLPSLVDRIVDPWLLKGPSRWLVSHHPRYARLRGE